MRTFLQVVRKAVSNRIDRLQNRARMMGIQKLRSADISVRAPHPATRCRTSCTIRSVYRFHTWSPIPPLNSYVDDMRPTSTALPTTIAAAAPGFMPPAPVAPLPPFVPYADAKNCAGYDNWPYGLKSRVGYASRLTDDQLKKQLAARPVTYLLGVADILPLGIFDMSCPAMAQGPTRLARGLAFSRYVKEHYGANHTTVVVPCTVLQPQRPVHVHI